MRIIVTGTRRQVGRRPAFLFFADLCEVYEPEEVTIVHGACPTGVDAMAQRYAVQSGFKVERFPADWTKHGRRAGPIRNQAMVDAGADMAWAYKPRFDRLSSKGGGTEDCVGRALTAGIPVWLVDLVNPPGWC